MEGCHGIGITLFAVSVAAPPHTHATDEESFFAEWTRVSAPWEVCLVSLMSVEMVGSFRVRVHFPKDVL